MPRRISNASDIGFSLRHFPASTLARAVFKEEGLRVQPPKC